MSGIIQHSSILQFSLNRGCQARCRWQCSAADLLPSPYGNMSVADWLRAVKQARSLGIHRLRFIGCEPTSHTGLWMVMGAAREAGLTIELHTNLFDVSDRLWRALCETEAALVVQLYGHGQFEHDAIDGRCGARARLIAGCREADARGLTYQLCSPSQADDMQQVRAHARHPTILETGRVCMGMPYAPGMTVLGNAIYQPLEDILAPQAVADAG